MTLQVLLYIYLVNSSFCDTLVLPLKEGNVKTTSSRSDIFHAPFEAVIYPTRYFEVASCSYGEVINIKQEFEDRFSVMIKTDSLFFTYIMDTVNVKKGEWVEKAQTIGKLRIPVSKKALEENTPLIFIVSKMKRLVNANRYLVFNKE